MKGKTDDSKYDYFVSEKFPELLATVKKYFLSPDCGMIVMAPFTDVIQRTDQIVQDHSHIFKLPIVAIDIKQGCENLDQLESELNKKNNSLYSQKGCYVMLRHTEYCFKTNNIAFLDDLVSSNLKSKSTKFVFFTEINLKSEESLRIYSKTNLLAQMYYFPLLSTADAERFLIQMSRMWECPRIKKSDIRKIVGLCGGQIWLLTNAIREYRNNPKIDFYTLPSLESTQFRVNKIASVLSQDEISALMGNKHVPKEIIKHLTLLGMLSKNKCTVKLLFDHLNAKNTGAGIVLKNRDLHSMGINLRHSFTDQENIVMKLLLENIDKVITRDEIAEKIWRHEAEEKYSVWAVEQLIKRLRTKLHEMNITATSITTIRGEGYSIRKNKIHEN